MNNAMGYVALALGISCLWRTARVESRLDAKIQGVRAYAQETGRLGGEEVGRAGRAVCALVSARSNDVAAINRELGNVYRSLDSVLFVATNQMPKVVAESVSRAVNRRLTETEDRMLNEHETRLIRLERRFRVR